MLNRAVFGPLLIAAAATVAFFHRAVFTDGIFNARDIQRVYYPLKAYWVARVSSGEFPQWYPYDGLGQSFVGMVISGAFHPFNFLYLALSLESALKASVLLSFVFASLGAFALARRAGGNQGAAVAAVLFAFNGYLVGVTNNLLYLMGAATLPWALWAVDRVFESPSVPRVGAAAGILTLLLYTGDSQSFTLACALVPIVFLIRHRPGHGRQAGVAAAAILALTALLSAVQILPALAVLPQSLIANQPLSTVLTWSMHPLRLVEMALGPLFASEPNLPVAGEIARGLLEADADQLWVESVYLGLPALILCAIATIEHRNDRRLWLGWAVLSVLLVLALGKHAGLYGLLSRFAPLWRNFRYPEKLLPFVMLGLSLLAGMGFEVVQRAPVRRKQAGWASLIGGALALAASQISESLCRWMWSSVPSNEALAQLSASTRQAGLLTGLLMVLFGAVVLATRKEVVRATLVAMLLFLGLFIANEPTYALTTREFLHSPAAFIQTIAEREGPARLGGPRVFGGSDAYAVPKLEDVGYRDAYAAVVASSLEAVTPAHFGLEGANAYLPAASARARRLADRIPACPTCASAIGAGYVALSSARVRLPASAKMTEVADAPRYKLHLLSIADRAPRVFLADRRCVATAAEALSAVSSPDFAPLSGSVAECSPNTVPPNQTAPGSAEILSYAAERVELRAQASRPVLLILTDAFSPGWQAMLDGSPAPILVANYAVRAVEVPAGEHRIVFSYHTPLLRVGLQLGLVGVLLWTAAFVFIWRRARGAPPSRASS